MIAVPAITTSPMDMTAQEPATPAGRGDGLDFRLILLGYAMPWIGAPECIDLGFANHSSGKEPHEDPVARPAVVSNCSAPKRPFGRAPLLPHGECESTLPGVAEVGSEPAVSAVVEGEISTVPEGGEEGPHSPKRARSSHSSTEAAKTQEGAKPPAMSQVSPPPVSPVEAVEVTSSPSPQASSVKAVEATSSPSAQVSSVKAVEATSFSSAQVSPVETAPITALPSPPLASPDSAWFAPTHQNESGSLLPPLV